MLINYIQNLINIHNDNIEMDPDDTDEFEYQVNYDNISGFLTNYRIIQNTYLLRRSLELSSNVPPSTPILQTPRSSISSSFEQLPPFNLQMENFTTDLVRDLLMHFTEDMTDFINSNLEDVKVVLTDKEFEQLPEITDNNSLCEEKCNICLEEFGKEETLIQLPCKHIFHKNCIKEWLTKQSTKCPICRNCCKQV